ncbi:MAG: hypothetical protein HC900_01675, partial [Methylacidiphilales bacterium]|nr:hypothetical protein [Candidatus Methylacidiphilales bacterium]
MLRVAELTQGGASDGAAAHAVAREAGVSVSTIKRLWRTVKTLPKAAWLDALVPGYKGRKADDVHPEILRCFLSDFGRQEQPQLQAVYERTCRAAAKNGWGEVPSLKTLKRRWDDLPAETRTLLRHGQKGLDALLPAAERDRSGMRPMQGLNIDSRTWDIRIDRASAPMFREVSDLGEPVAEGCFRVAVAILQDERSNLILSWDFAPSESSSLYRRVICAGFETHGLSDYIRFDNTRAAANKALTGGAKNRFRFTEREDDIPGILPRLGVEVRFAIPHNGRSKLVERAFAELKERSEKHP